LVLASKPILKPHESHRLSETTNRDIPKATVRSISPAFQGLIGLQRIMPATLEPLRRIKCTYGTCYESFDSEKAMKNHKKHSDEHDYCDKCDEDFADYEAFARHKVLKPMEHNKACRVCGDEFKSGSGLQRHIELVSDLAESIAPLLIIVEPQD
jgi:hypothetical protein